MADKEKNEGELCSVNIRVAENGYQICCCYEQKDSLSQRAGWVPSCMNSKDYVEKTKEGLLKTLKEVLK
jgi:hypothetical protein